MDTNTSELLEKIRQQFDTAPYPTDPVEKFPDVDVSWLYIHNLVTPYYLRNHKVIETEGKVILDAGCGTGYKSLALALANPGAKIIGIDLSEESVGLARQRLQLYEFNNVEFQVLSIEDLHQLSWKFDYINCDEVLYLLPNPIEGLKVMRAALKPNGIIRTNLHSSLQRHYFFNAQKLFKMMGLMNTNPGEVEIDSARELILALKNNVVLKKNSWKPPYDNHSILINYLLQGDKGYTVPEMFSALKIAKLEFISMVNWNQWDLMNLFNAPDNLPVFVRESLAETTTEQQLHFFELLHPIHRLLDFWCGHPHEAQPFEAVADWTDSTWQQVNVHLHPQLRTSAIEAELIRCISHLLPFDLNELLPFVRKIATLDSTMAACLLPLWENAQLMPSLVERWQKLRPVHPVSLEPTTQEEAFEVVKQTVMKLEKIGYVLLEC